MIWNRLARSSRLPAFWNLFPFHPHPVGNPGSNRTPSEAETQFGIDVLDLVIHILNPRRVFTLGQVANSTLSEYSAALGARNVHHPSSTGYLKFVSRMIAYEII
jgi:hypothetical protein